MNNKNITIQDFINFLGTGTPKNTNGSNIYFKCPKCKDNQYKLGVLNDGSGVFNCNKCNYSGNLKKILNDNNKTYNFSDTYKPALAPIYKTQEKKKIDTKALKVFYDFMTEKYLNDNEIKTFCEKEYFKERNQIIPSNVSFYKKYWIKEFILKNKEIALELNKHGLFHIDFKTNELVSNEYLEDYLLFFHVGLNDEIEHITPALFKSLREGKIKKYPKLKDRFEKGKHYLSNTPIVSYGNFTLNKPEYFENLLAITESIEKYQPCFLGGYSGLGLGGINQWKALIESILPIKDKLIQNETKIVFLFDSKQNINTKELEAIIKNSKELNKIGIKNIYVAEVPKPEFLSDTKDNDLNDLLLPLDTQDKQNKALKKLFDESLSLEKYLETKALTKTKKPIDDLFLKNKFEFINYNGKKENYPSIKEIKENKKISLVFESFINEYENKQKLLVLKSTAGTGKTTSIIDIPKKHEIRTIYVAPNNALLEDIEQSLIENKINYHIEKSFTQLCKDTHKLNNIDISDKNSIEYQKSNYKKLVELVSRGYESKTACTNCPFRQTCKVINKEVPGNEVKIMLFTYDKFLLSQKMIKEFNAPLLVIDESINDLILDETIIDEIELKKINDFYKDKHPGLTKALKLLNFIITDLPKNELFGKELYTHYKNHYKNFSKALSKINISEIKEIINNLELEKNNDVALLPNKNSLINFIKDIKTSKLKSSGYLEKSLYIYSKKEIDLSIFRNIINIDATASKEIIKATFNLNDTNIRFENINAINPNLTIYQDYNFSFKASQLEKKEKRFNDFLKFLKIKASDSNKKILVVAPLSFQKILESEESLKEFNNITYKHHRELKGVNHLGNNDICIITDTKNNLDIMKLKCFALFGIVPKIIKRKVKTNVIENNRQLEIEQICFDDKLCNEYLEQNRSAEIYQCYKRIDRLGSDTKEVYYLGQNNLSEFTKESILPFNIAVKNQIENIRLKKEYYELEKIVLDLIENVGVISKQILHNLVVKNENISEIKNNTKVLENSKNLLPLYAVNRTFTPTLYNIYTVVPKDKSSNSLILSTKTFESFFSEIIKNNDLISKKISLLDNGFYKPLLFLSATKENLDILEQEIKAFNSSQKLTAPTPGVQENIIPGTFDKNAQENIKDITLTEIARSFYLSEVRKALTINRIIDKHFFLWIKNNCELNKDGTLKNFTYFNSIKNKFNDKTDIEIKIVLLMVLDFFSKYKDKINNYIQKKRGFINMNNFTLGSDNYKSRLTSKIIQEGTKRFNKFKADRIRDLKIIDIECLMAIDKYSLEKNISDNELLVREWFYKLVIEYNEFINDEINYTLKGIAIPNKIIQLKSKHKPEQKEYLQELAEKINLLISKSNINQYIDPSNKCWSDGFKAMNDGLEYNFFIRHISIKFTIPIELSKILFDYYPNQLQAFINFA